MLCFQDFSLVQVGDFTVYKRLTISNAIFRISAIMLNRVGRAFFVVSLDQNTTVNC